MPVTCGPTSTVIAEPSVSTTVNDSAASFGSGDTRIARALTVCAPRVSDTVTCSVTTCGSVTELCACWYTMSPAGVVATAPDPVSSTADISITGSPSGSTQPLSTGTVTVPPGATSGSGQVVRHPAVAHHCGAEFAPSGTTVKVTSAAGEFSPSAAVPSVTW